MAVPRSGRRSLRPTANFSRPRDSSHRLPSGIEALGKYTIKKPAVGNLLTAGLVGMAGIEPARAESKSAVLPLDYTPV